MKKNIKCILSAVMMLILILDSKTARYAAYAGIDLCIRSVIPSLFPFILVSTVFNRNLNGINFPCLKPVCSLCKIPDGCSSYLLLGIFGGYPVGAKCINDAYKNGDISKAEGHRLLGFCNNAGPSFIFGIIGALFAKKSAVWALWSIHIVSALMVGIMLPACTHESNTTPNPGFPKSDGLITGIKTMSIICTWVIIFKMILIFCETWFLRSMSNVIGITISGFFELTNGCIQLSSLSNPGTRFILTSLFLSFGGICVTMQTISVTRDVGQGQYFIGKLMQTLISFLLAYFLQYQMFETKEHIWIPTYFISLVILTLLITVFLLHRKKVVAFLGKLMYTVHKT